VPLVSVIVPSFNGKAVVGECLESLKGQRFRDFETILVDNASTDGTAAFVRENYPEVKVVVNDGNLGFGGGVNVGLRQAEGRCVALLNNDAVADPGWLSGLVSAAGRSEGRVGMWASKILCHGRPGEIDTAGHRLYPDGLNIGRGKGEKDSAEYGKEEEVLFPSGCAAMYRREVFYEVGGFDEEFFAYGDDTEMGLRARLAGWKCLYAPSSVVYHRGSETMGRHSALKAYYIERNRVWVLLKCFPGWRILASPFYTALRLFWHLAYALAGRGAAGRMREGASIMALVRIYLKADLDALKGARRMLEKRREVQRLRKVSGGEFSLWLRRFGISAREIASRE
jgi:GT2 family glycosyltransferase